MDGSKNNKKNIEKETWENKIEGLALRNVTAVRAMKPYGDALWRIPSLKIRVYPTSWRGAVGRHQRNCLMNLDLRNRKLNR